MKGRGGSASGFRLERGTAWILPADTEEVHDLDAGHVAAIGYDGDIQVVGSVGVVVNDGLVYSDEQTGAEGDTA